MDLFITLLSLGSSGWLKLLQQRQDNFLYLYQQLKILFEHKFNEQVINTLDNNEISIAISCNSFKKDDSASYLGAMFYNRLLSGIRIIDQHQQKSIWNYHFNGYGASCINYPHTYMTFACAIGMTKDEINLLISKIDQILSKLRSKKKFFFFFFFFFKNLTKCTPTTI